MMHDAYSQVESAVLTHGATYRPPRFVPVDMLPLRNGPDKAAHGSVTGILRYKYFEKSPDVGPDDDVQPVKVIPTANLILGMPGSSASELQAGSVTMAEPLSKDVAVQTMYRESEAQTDPYSPDFALDDANDEPEELRLARAGMSWGHGLPAGQEEIELIEYLRKRKVLEDALPPLEDTSQLDRRKALMQEQELLDLEYRANRITRIQDEKLEMLKQTMTLREKDRREVSGKKIAAVEARLNQFRDREMERIQRRRVQALRKLALERQNVEGKLRCKNIVEEYSDPSSRAYAPILREGAKGVSDSILKTLKAPTPTQVQQLEPIIRQALEQETPPPTTKMEDSTLRKDRRDQLDSRLLEQLETRLKLQSKGGEDCAPSIYAQRIEKAPPRPPTPSIEAPVEDEEKTMALLLLQRLLRGRAVQNQMYEGSLRRKELVKELTTKPVEEEEAPEDVLNEAMEIEGQHQRLECEIQAFVGQVVGDTLDFLAKHLVRMREHQKLLRMAEAAEKIRHQREKEESERRRLEIDLQRQASELYSQVMAVHYETAQTYLESILQDASESTAALQAYARAKKVQSWPSAPMHEPETLDAAVAQLLEIFLLPTVEKQSIDNHESAEDKKFRKAALDTLFFSLPRTWTKKKKGFWQS